VNTRDVEDAFFRYDGALLEISDQALVEDPTPRLHLIRAAAARFFGLDIDSSREIAEARELPGDPVDTSLAAALEVFLTEGPFGSVELFLEHATAFPDDLLGAFFRFGSLVSSGVPGYRARASAFVEADARRHQGNWRFDALFAMVREEQRRYDEAREIAERTLAEQPSCAPAVHVIAHVNYETGEHAAGIAWLDGWRSQITPLFYVTHFPWHNALHELALGDVDAALDRYATQIGPTATIDAGSLLWRCHLTGKDVHERGRAAASTVVPLLEALPSPFFAYNACLALAAAGDTEDLAAVAGRLETDARPAFADLIAPIARGLLAMLGDAPGDAVECLEAVVDDLPRLGGSDAQREVVEDTLLRALVAAGRATEAEPLLRARLLRRPHALDEQLLAVTGDGQ
jgi:hypothetical protein